MRTASRDNDRPAVRVRPPMDDDLRMGPPTRMRSTLSLFAAALFAGSLAARPLAPRPTADVERYTLSTLMDASEGATIGSIVSKTFEIVDVGDGAPLVFTRLEVRGTDLATGAPDHVEVLFPGGYADDENASFSPSAPARHETRLGRQVLVFHRHSDNMGGGLAGQVLVGSRAGLFTSFTAQDGRTIVQGRGRGYALALNTELKALRSRVR